MGEGQTLLEFDIAEIERNGATRVYRAHFSSDRVRERVTANLDARVKTIRLPGFRPGKIPPGVMEQRYGSAARGEVAHQLAAQAADRIFATGGLASGIEMASGAAAGDLEFRITVTHLPDLPDIDFSQLALERLTASSADLEAAGVTTETAREIFDDHLRQQVLDYLDSAYGFTLAPALIEREFRAISGAAESQMDAAVADQASRESIAAELRVIAERRVRLGAVVRELARRNNIDARDGESMESNVVRWLAAQAAVSERSVTGDELRELAT
jgi:FKBP-type peptidyl-prolyl cis-trans isomerase (trigger factor)